MTSCMLRTLTRGTSLFTLQTTFRAAEVTLVASEVALRTATNIDGHCAWPSNW